MDKGVAKRVYQKLKHGTVVIKCPKCGYVADDSERLRIKGVAEKDDGRWVKVDGFVVWSYGRGFEGIGWNRMDVGSSDEEKAQCTECGKWSPFGEWGFYDL